VLSATAVRTVKLPSGEAVPVLGQGTWHLAEDRHRREEEIHALRVGLDLGMTLIDTAEMYADGGAEELVGEAIEGRRSDVFLVSKVLPEHATVRGTITACERRPLSVALAGRNPVGRDDQRVRCTGSGWQDPLLGRQQL
jgi:diketogulonate reductase-like aldo/keto reductase